MWACNLSTAYRKLGDFKTAKEHHQLHQIITKEMADGAVKGRASSNLAVNFQALRHYQKAVEYHQLYHDIVKELGDGSGEGHTYGNLDSVFHLSWHFQKRHRVSPTTAYHLQRNRGEGCRRKCMWKSWSCLLSTT